MKKISKQWESQERLDTIKELSYGALTNKIPQRRALEAILYLAYATSELLEANRTQIESDLSLIGREA